MAVVAAGAVVAMMSGRVVVTFWAMMAFTVAYLPMCPPAVVAAEAVVALMPDLVVVIFRTNQGGHEAAIPLGVAARAPPHMVVVCVQLSRRR